MSTRPFGQPNIDDWLYWVDVPDMGETIAVRYRRKWYIIGRGLMGYQVALAKGKKVISSLESRPIITYQDLPWIFQADLDQWKHLLIKALGGL